MGKTLSKLVLKPGREKSLLRFHPWVFSGAVARVEGELESGATVDVFSSGGQFLARGAYSQKSQIVCRVWAWDQRVTINGEFLRGRLKAAIERRGRFETGQLTNAYRLVHAESDGIPGLIVDRYAELLVVQFLSFGVEVWRDEIAALLIELTGIEAVYERSDAEVRRIEGLEIRVGWLAGSDIGDQVEIVEHGLKYLVPYKTGHKTGFYLDQRENRKKLGEYTEGREVLDCFSYSGGFGMHAVRGGARKATLVDSSEEANQIAVKNIGINDLDLARFEMIEADVFSQLRTFRDQGRQFDVIVLDPPKFAPTRAQVNKAARGYKDINLLAFKLLRPGGHLFTFSCSGGVDEALFQKIVADGAVDAGVGAQIVERLHQDEDHPVALNFPEGAYLKGLVCRVNE